MACGTMILCCGFCLGVRRAMAHALTLPALPGFVDSSTLVHFSANTEVVSLKSVFNGIPAECPG
jgi:hypothetical protein